MKIYYIPFKVETYIPVTIDDIEKRAFYSFKVPESSKLTIELKKLLNANIPGTFNNKAVRLKVIEGSNIYYVDSLGNIYNLNKITKTKLGDLENIIDKMILPQKSGHFS
jgi:hypothetical protein